MKKVKNLLICLLLAASPAVFAGQDQLGGLGIRLGEDISSVKVALHTDIDPEPIPRNPALPPNAPDFNRGRTLLHLRTKGVLVVFGQDGRSLVIRLDSPYSGSVMGIRLGDGADRIAAKLGKPIKKPWPAFMNMQAYRYVLDDSAYVTFDVSDNGVQYIFISR